MNGRGGSEGMENKIVLMELPCFSRGSEHDKEKFKMYFYDLDRLSSNKLKNEWSGFILARGTKLSLRTMKQEIIVYNVICRFLSDKKTVVSLLDVQQEIIVRDLKVWLIKNNYKICCNHFMKSSGKNQTKESEYMVYLRKLLQYLQPADDRKEKEKDIWVLDNLDFVVRQNPIAPQKTFRFTDIVQLDIKEEVKEACYIQLKYLAVGSIAGQLRGIKRLSKFLNERYPGVKSCKQITRPIMEDFLVFMNTELNSKKNYSTELIQLKNMLKIIGKCLELPDLSGIFLKSDMQKKPRILFRFYSDEELRRLNSYIINMDKQIARALIIHQMLGNRISDTLTMKTDCLNKEDGTYIVRIDQVKTGVFEKPISEDAAALIMKSIEYTREKYGDTKYIFVSDVDPNKPYQYAALKSRVKTMIYENDIRDDKGKLFGFGTHMFRHCYAVKLTEMHLSDEMIAKLLGHRGIRSVHHYRKVSGMVMAEETQEVRLAMDTILSDLIKRWDGYEELFLHG